MRASHSPIVTLLLLLLRCFVTALAAIPDLPFGDINVVVVTDVHSFIGGHPHEPNRNANYGHVLSFYERLKEWCDENDRDLWFVMNGDFVHGTGLAMNGNASALVPILNHMPWDAVTIGNHEAYNNAVVELMQDSLIPNFQGKYLTSNVLKSDTKEPFGGSRYRLLEGKKHTVLVFGFLYNLHNPSELLEVTKVEDAVQEEWFNKTLMTEVYDAILVLAHMDVEDPLVKVIRDAIRGIVGSGMPIQFLTGHTHIRAQTKVDWLSHSFEAGANLDTVGFVSFPTQAHFQLDSQDAKAAFQYQFIDASVPALSKALNLLGEQESLQTENGTALAKLIHDTQDALGLRDIVGCPGRDYFRNVSIHHPDSLWKLWQDHVVKTQIFTQNPKSVMMITSDSWRYDLRGSGISAGNYDDAMTVDDVVAIAPFMEPVVYVGKVAEWIVRRANNSLNTDSHHAMVPDYVLAGDVEASGDYDFYTHEYNLPEILAELTRLHAENLNPKRTGTRDTLYWLNYIEQAMPCKGQVKDVDPWFQNKDELEEEATDGHRTSESLDDIEAEDEEEEVEDEGNNQEEQPKIKKKEAKYYGYMAPAVAAQHDLPPAYAPSKAHAVNYPAPSHSTTNKNPAPHKRHSTPEEKKAKMVKRKKMRKTMFKVCALLFAAALLITPLVCLYLNVWGGKDQKDRADPDDVLYDQEEVAFLRGGGKKGKRKNRSRPPPSEIEIT